MLSNIKKQFLLSALEDLTKNPIPDSTDPINDVANIYSHSFEEYQEISDYLEGVAL